MPTLEIEKEEVMNIMNCLVVVSKLPNVPLEDMKHLINLHDKIASQAQAQASTTPSPA